MDLKNTIILLNRPEKHFLESFYFAKIKYGIDAALTDTKYNLLMVQQDAHLPESLTVKNAAGCGVLNIAPHTGHHSIEFLEKEDIPSVLINCRSEKVSWVDVDNVRGAAVMTEHLIKLGHERILFINGFEESQNSIDRLKGYHLALERYHIKPNPKLVLNCNFSVTLAYEGMKSILHASKKPDFTAVFATNDYMAVGVARALTDAGLRVPEDIAVVGFDDFDFASSFLVPLTTYRQPFHNIGFLSTKMLMREIETRHAVKCQQAELIGEIVVRDSCGEKLRNR